MSYVLIAILYFGGHYIGYGNLFSNCAYTEAYLPAPASLTVGKLVLVKDSSVANGVDSEFACRETPRSINRELLSDSQEYQFKIWPDRDIKLERIKAGTEFIVEGVTVTRAHGLADIEGVGPIYYLNLKDTAGNRYKVGTYSLGAARSYIPLAFITNGESDTNTMKVIDSRNFKEGVIHDEISYNGTFTEFKKEQIETKFVQPVRVEEKHVLTKWDRTLLGVDDDKNGIRDEIDTYIKNNPQKLDKDELAYLPRIAKTLQYYLVANGVPDKSIEAYKMSMADDELYRSELKRSTNDSRGFVLLMAATFNTPERRAAFEATKRVISESPLMFELGKKK